MTNSKSDDDRVRFPVYMTRKQRREFNTIAASRDMSASDYILQPALERLAADQAAQHQQREEARDANQTD